MADELSPRQGCGAPRRHDAGRSSGGSRPVSCPLGALEAAGVSRLTRLTRSVPRSRPPRRPPPRPDPNAVHRQPRRDRGANHADLLAAGHSCGRAGHRRTRSARPARRRARSWPRQRRPARTRSTPGFGFLAESARLRRGRDRGRAFAGSARRRRRSARMGDKAAARRLAVTSRRPGPPRLRRRRPVRRGALRGRAADRAAGPRQAGGRRRRQGHADRARHGSAG